MSSSSKSADPETLARQLERHPDYRVLRRLDTSREHPALSGSGISRAVVLDTETTGMDFATDRIIELGLVVFEYSRESGLAGRVLASYNGLEDPGIAIPPESTAIHGITDEMVAGKRLDDAAIGELLRGVALVIAHNAGFDRRFVEPRLPLFANLPWACSFREIPWDRAGIGSAKLDYLASRYGFFYDGHRAEIDCRALLEVLRRPMPEVAPAAGAAEALQIQDGSAPAYRVATGEGVTALKLLLDSAREPSYRVWASGSPFETKDILKARQYRWDGDAKCWYRDVGAAELDTELQWLKAAVFAGRSARIDIDTMDARDRYSDRTGKREKRSL